MLRFASSPTMYFTRSMCPGERYAGSPLAISRRPGERLIMKIPFASIWSRSKEILRRTSAWSAPFQLWNCCIAPYSRGGEMKFAATSAVDGTVITCHGRGDCACAAPGLRRRLRLRSRSQYREEQNWKEEAWDEREPAGSLHCIDSESLIFLRPGVYSAACAASHQPDCRTSTAPQPASS